jgi:hypothetical protein
MIERSGVSFNKSSDAFGSGLVINGDRIREKSQYCKIVRRRQEGDTILLPRAINAEVLREPQPPTAPVGLGTTIKATNRFYPLLV